MEDTNVNRAEIRETYIKYAKLFLKHQCHYSYSEELAAAKVVKVTMAVDPKGEGHNDKYPDHGEPLPEHY